MNSLIPPHLQTSHKISLGRLELAKALSIVLTHLHIQSWPIPTRPFIQMTITFLEKEYLKILSLAHNELGEVVKTLEEKKSDNSTTK